MTPHPVPPGATAHSTSSTTGARTGAIAPRVEVHGVPFDGYGRAGHQAAAAAVLRKAGLVDALVASDAGDLDLPTGDERRGASSLVNESALLVQTEQLTSRVASTLRAGRFPLLIGGDCTTLLGSMAALTQVTGRAGLVFLDGHEDTMPLDVSEDGEAANSEIGLLLGLTGRTLVGPLTRHRGLLTPRTLAVLGPRDQAWRQRFNVGSVRDLGVEHLGVDQVARAPRAAAARAVAHVRSGAPDWWLHVDLDVLDPAHFAAQGLPDVPDEPGGLTLDQLETTLVAAVAAGGCVGMSVAIYDPDQDPNRDDAAAVVRLVAACLAPILDGGPEQHGVDRTTASRIAVLGAPNSAGAYCVGVERAPEALRAAGLVQTLTRHNEVRDLGDLVVRRWVPDRVRPLLQNLQQEVQAADELGDVVAEVLGGDERVLVLGGSCTVALGTCVAMARATFTPRMVYIDRHLDLNTPHTTVEGSLSWMGMAHALGVDGAATELAHLHGPGPLLRPQDLVYLGVALDETTDGERAHLDALGITVVPQGHLITDPRAAARSAVAALPTGPFMVHLDVDVLDFMDCPVAENVNGRNTGPSVVQAQEALAELWAAPACIGLSIGQIDPTHAGSDPTALPRLIDALHTALRPA